MTDKIFGIEKAQYAADVFTTPEEARARSYDLGLNGEIHVEDYNGQAVYLPAKSREAYLRFYMDIAGIPADSLSEFLESGTNKSEVDPLEALRIIVREVLNKEVLQVAEITKSVEGKILKSDEEQRLVYGWASVITEKGEPVIDRQGDVIKADTLVKAVNGFMETVRVGKEMHKGEQIGVVLHSLPITKEIGEALGIQSDREGWVVAFKVYNDDVWEKVKSGELAAFSIGGRATKEVYNA